MRSVLFGSIAYFWLLLAVEASASASSQRGGHAYEMRVQLVYDSTLAEYFSSTSETEKYLTTFVQQVNTILAHRSLSREVQLRLIMTQNPPKRLSRADVS
uniref:SEA domain-containing protein n=1 Tax=Macrostomum lignano TaxID=282301 RepID=A0A1I8HG63_9PLAT